MAGRLVQSQVHGLRVGVLDDHAYGGVAADQSLTLEVLVDVVEGAVRADHVAFAQVARGRQDAAGRVSAVEDLNGEVVGDLDVEEVPFSAMRSCST